jgi:2-dehydropantoate 2-reductase
MSDWPRTAVVGAGAVGCYFGGMLARAGAPVTLIGRPGHVMAIRRDGLLLDTLHFREHVKLDASTEPDAVAGAGLVLVCVKSGDTEAAARSIAPHLARDATVVSLQNGVPDGGSRTRAAYRARRPRGGRTGGRRRGRASRRSRRRGLRARRRAVQG